MVDRSGHRAGHRQGGQRPRRRHRLGGRDGNPPARGRGANSGLTSATLAIDARPAQRGLNLLSRRQQDLIGSAAANRVEATEGPRTCTAVRARSCTLAWQHGLMSASPASPTLEDFDPADQSAVRDLILAGLADHWGELDASANRDLDDIASTYAAGRTLVARDETGAIVGTATRMARPL